MNSSYIARVKGLVQGVGFRYSALNRARSLRLSGWVRNEADGSVTARFEGPEADCRNFIQWLEHGPSMASVSSVDLKEMNYEGDIGSFRVTY